MFPENVQCPFCDGYVSVQPGDIKNGEYVCIVYSDRDQSIEEMFAVFHIKICILCKIYKNIYYSLVEFLDVLK